MPKPARANPVPTRSSPRNVVSPPKLPPRRPAGTRRSARHEKHSPEHLAPQQRTRLRLRAPVIPTTHPDVIPRPRTAPTFGEYWERSSGIPVEEGGLYASEDGLELTDEMAENEARLLMRIEAEVQPGGILSEGKCSALVPDPQDEPPRQWAHWDHFLKAMSNFRRLMLAEHQRHRQTAKRLAEACRDEWIRRQPKSAEQLEAEEKELCIGRYKTVIRVLFGTWENVRAEINRRRVHEWKLEEEKRVKAALNKAVNMSERKLQARRAHFDSEGEDEDEDEDEYEYEYDEDDVDEMEIDVDQEEDLDDGGEDDDREEVTSEEETEDGQKHESNMSSSDDDMDDKVEQSDEELTLEQLRQKYSNIPDLDMGLDVESEEEEATATRQDVGVGQNSSTASPGHIVYEETSDESIDMDDDSSSGDGLGSGPAEDDSEEGGDEVDDESDEPCGLLGLLFGKSELNRMQEEAAAEEEADILADHESDDEQPIKANGIRRVDEEPIPVKRSESYIINGASNKLEAKKMRPLDGSGNHFDPDRRTVPVSPDRSAGIEKILAVRSHNKPQELPHMNGDTPSDLHIDKNNNDTTASGVSGSAPAVDAQTIAVTSAVAQDSWHKGAPAVDEVSIAKGRSSSRGSLSSLVNGGAEGSPSTSTALTGPKTDIPFLLRGTLREYQHYGLDWLAGLYANKTNGILADEMGLGKTIQTIALLAHLACHHEIWGPHLVIVPTSVMLNWEMEFKKWCPGFKILSYYGSIEERKRKRQGWTNDDVWNVCVTSYQLVLADQQVFKRRRWHYMILDEAHNIKNFKSQRWQTLLGFNTHSRLLLTGTPLQNNLTELWSLLFFLMPPENGEGGFADLQEFQDWFHRPEAQILESGRDQMDEEGRAIIQKLHKVLRPYLLRRLKADVEKQMPAKYEHVEFCRLSKRQRELYDGFLARTDTRETLASGNYLSIINCLMQLRKVCNHPDLFIDRPVTTSLCLRSSVPGEYQASPCRFLGKMLRPSSPMKGVSPSFLNLVPRRHEHMSAYAANRIANLSSGGRLMALQQAQSERAGGGRTNFEPATVLSNISYLESTGRWGRLEELQHCVYVNSLRRQRRPIYGKRLIERLTVGIQDFPRKPRPNIPLQVMGWFEDESPVLISMVQTLEQRADCLSATIQKFACTTRPVVTWDAREVILGHKGVEGFAELDLRLSAPVRYAPFIPPEPPWDPWHGPRMRLSIQFPDKRLLQYDCGKLQTLDRLLRKLRAGGHRALIFTQMTKVLDILEQFLNIHGHKYLRLDGATKIEQRQILTDRFNHDPRILCFILSTRSGGLGINLTGADTVIFYDQDWNPAMDKQCQDRCHRIGQTRDVHIYRLVSEHTIEANILRKASQKQMLDDVVIQEGEFTTDYFNKLSVQDVIGDKGDGLLGNMAANEAMDRLLGQSDNNPRSMNKVLEQAEDKEDVQAARAAEKEIQTDYADFGDKGVVAAAASLSSGAATRDASVARDRMSESAGPEAAAGSGSWQLGDEGQDEDMPVEYNAWGERMGNIDDHMLRCMALTLQGTPLELPKDSRKKGRDRRRR